MRTKNSLKNIIAALITNFINIILGMTCTTLFIKFLDIEYMGINGLFSNIISMLNIAELGIGNAIVVNLYKPIRDNDIEKIKSLMGFYKKAYNTIIIIMLGLGVLVIPFLDIIVGNVTIPINLTIVYILVLLSSICTYIHANKRSILYANQKNYILKKISIIYLFVCNILQIIILYLTKNYYLYLMIKIICQILENITISSTANKNYKFLKEKNYSKLDKQSEKSIWKKVGALSIHKISSFVVNGTDNIIISSFLGIISVGLYSNYYLIINNVKNVFFQVMSAFSASIGDLIAENNSDKSYLVFKRVRLFNIWIAIFSSICLLVITQDFIKLWIGKKYLLSNLVLFILVLNYYQNILQRTYKNFKDGAGIWEEDKFIPIIEAILNIIFSVLLLKIFGLAGVFMGTVISSSVYWFYSYPKFIHKGLFKKRYSEYIMNLIIYLLLFILVAYLTCKVSSLFVVSNLLLRVIIDILICCIIPNVTLLIIFHRSDEFKYYYNLLKQLFFKKKEK